jgi:hypothetical protein
VNLYSYVVARDYGFAPNPFYGTCTLATCKPVLRRKASVGDWVIGTGSAENALAGRLVYAMRVTETMSFDDYFVDPRFQEKKPNLSGSLKQAFGDNIYFRDSAGEWQQLDSHHSLQDGSPNPSNIGNDTNPNRLLLADQFAYFGVTAPEIPSEVRHHGTDDICALRHYKVNFNAEHVEHFLHWFERLGVTGLDGTPYEWLRNGALRR